MSWHFTLQTRAVPRLFFGPRRNRRVPHPRHPHPHRRRRPPDSASPSLHPPQAPLLQSLPRRRRPPPLPHHASFLNRVLYFSDGPFRDTSIGDHRDVFG